MSRYFYYNIVLVSMLNLMLFVPTILIKYRYTGAISSMVIAIFIGSLLAVMFTHVMKKYPGMGIPEILKLYVPHAVAVPILLFMALMWFIASALALVAFAVLINRFFNPDTSPVVVLLLLSGVCIYSATRSTMTVLFLIEMGLIINQPLILFILIKAIRSEAINWDAIRTVANYWIQAPKLQAVSAATYLFTGYINYAIFNRVNPPNIRIKYRWVIPIIGIFNMIVTFFVPIGFHGTETVDDYLYLWSITADSLIMNYGFIERVIFVFLIMYLSLTLLYVTVGWHQAIEFVKSCRPRSKPDIDEAKTPKISYITASLFALMSIAYLYLFNEKQNVFLSAYWLNLRFFAELIVVVLLFALALGRKRSG